MSFVSEVMARTSGPACPAVEARLAAFSGGRLDGVERALVEGHVATCAGCRSKLVRPLRAAWSIPWRSLALRPRFAVEVAYLAVVLASAIVVIADVNLHSVSGVVRTVISELRVHAELPEELP